MEKLIDFYEQAKIYCIEQGFGYEIDAVDERRFEDATEEDFFRQYMYVVINAGLRNQVAEVLFRRAIKRGLRAIAHNGKREAIEEGIKRKTEWFETLKSLKTTGEVLKFLESLPWIGPVTKYHLARNLGIDVAKPDRHLKALAYVFGYTRYIGCTMVFDVQEMCQNISEETGDRIGTIYLILWRKCNLDLKCLKEMVKNKSKQGSLGE